MLQLHIIIIVKFIDLISLIFQKNEKKNFVDEK